MMINPQLPEWLTDIKALPILPHDIHCLVNMLTDDSLDYKRMAKVLEAHQSISSRLLMLANSAWANTGAPVTSIEQACFKLGLNLVRGVSIGLAVMKPFNVNFCPAFDLQRYWATSMLVAHGAALLADQMPAAKQDRHYLKTVHTAGILHNIGLLCLAELKPQQTHKVLMLKAAHPEIDVDQAFHEALKIGYCAIGGLLATSWGIPDALVVCLQYHRSFDYKGPYAEQVRLVGAAAEWVGLLYRQEAMLASDYLDRQAIDLPRQQAIFSQLEAQFQETRELAAALFR